MGFSKISLEEKDFLEKVSTFSCVNIQTVKNIFKYLLKAITIELYGENTTIYIPYICKLEIKHYCKTNETGRKEVIVELESTVLDSLKDEIINVEKDDITPTEKDIKKGIINKISNILGVEDE